MEKETLCKHHGWTKNWKLGVFAIFAFLCLYWFFTVVHPLYIHDLDDWLYVVCLRHGVPDLNQWNPTRVLPETWMPMMAYLASWFVYPVNGDFVESVGLVFAATLACGIVVYVLMVGRLLKYRFQTANMTVVLLLSLFLLGHFLPFILDETQNVHLFYAHDVSCIFYYILPALLNYILCCIYLTQKKDQQTPMGKAVWFFAVYLAIFSNLFQSIILMSLFGCQLLFVLIEGIWKNRAEKQPWISWGYIKLYVRAHYEKILWIMVWLGSMLMEVSGARSDFSPAGVGIIDSLRTFRSSMININPIFQSSVTIINAAALVVALYQLWKKKEGKFLYGQIKILFCMGLTAVYLSLVCTKTGVSYLLRPDVMLSWMGWLLILTVSSMAYLVKTLPKTVYLLPLLVYLLLFETTFHISTYADYNVSQISADVVKAVDDDIIAQVKAAEDAGLREVEVQVPWSMSNYTWPLDTTLTGDRISEALFHHGVTDKKIHITIRPSPEKDAEYGLK